MENEAYHVPVLLQPSIDGLNINPNGTYVDVTFGGGGHSIEILKLLDKGKLIAFDQDPDAKKNLPEDDRILFVDQNFRFMRNFLQFNGITHVDGILADLGVSSHQFNVDARGFSTRTDGPLDMRMSQNGEKTAEHIVMTYNEDKLKQMFWLYGELKNAGKIARQLLLKREEMKIDTTEKLKEALLPVTPRYDDYRFLAQVFQALRIEVNEELTALEELLIQSLEVLAPDGRLVVISYHSLEDRMVKNIMRSGNLKGQQEKDFFGNLIRPLEPVNRKPLVPDSSEIERNNRARSAKLRVAQRNK
ncbi:MAG TPA: 16S rRNA (cytosine(1402)-N(4))-methyltransferase RsmH [Flavobacteriales bacterium]|nr:16S rRNA (cytosine(1402)-N(4))-methyltransferase RsmH [Flavobacteriales bacterium]|tara:strand:+ start:8222 stop:9130 length:909 start_codon:yes stop_codon:yes gene_type:complete